MSKNRPFVPEKRTKALKAPSLDFDLILRVVKGLHLVTLGAKSGKNSIYDLSILILGSDLLRRCL